MLTLPAVGAHAVGPYPWGDDIVTKAFRFGQIVADSASSARETA